MNIIHFARALDLRLKKHYLNIFSITFRINNNYNNMLQDN